MFLLYRKCILSGIILTLANSVLYFIVESLLSILLCFAAVGVRKKSVSTKVDGKFPISVGLGSDPFY